LHVDAGTLGCVDAEPKLRIMSWRWRLSISLALGLVTTVVVAWLIALLPPDYLQVNAPIVAGYVVIERNKDGSAWLACGEGTVSPLGSDVDIQIAAVQDEADVTRWTGYAHGDFATRYCDQDVLAAMPRRYGDQLTVHRCGWPCSALEWRLEAQYVPPGAFRAAASTRVGGFVLPLGWTPGSGLGVLPLIPRWGALGADTALFGFIWMSLLMLPRLARTVEWWWKRRCSVCGYDRRGLIRGAPCPECGNVSLTLKPR
jgi:hypothetical protein